MSAAFVSIWNYCIDAQGRQFAVRRLIENRDRVLKSLSRFCISVGRRSRPAGGRAEADLAEMPAVVVATFGKKEVRK